MRRGLFLVGAVAIACAPEHSITTETLRGEDGGGGGAGVNDGGVDVNATGGSAGGSGGVVNTGGSSGGLGGSEGPDSGPPAGGAGTADAGSAGQSRGEAGGASPAGGEAGSAGNPGPGAGSAGQGGAGIAAGAGGEGGAQPECRRYEGFDPNCAPVGGYAMYCPTGSEPLPSDCVWRDLAHTIACCADASLGLVDGVRPGPYSACSPASPAGYNCNADCPELPLYLREASGRAWCAPYGGVDQYAIIETPDASMLLPPAPSVPAISFGCGPPSGTAAIAEIHPSGGDCARITLHGEQRGVAAGSCTAPQSSCLVTDSTSVYVLAASDAPAGWVRVELAEHVGASECPLSCP